MCDLLRFVTDAPDGFSTRQRIAEVEQAGSGCCSQTEKKLFGSVFQLGGRLEIAVLGAAMNAQ